MKSISKKENISTIERLLINCKKIYGILCHDSNVQKFYEALEYELDKDYVYHDRFGEYKVKYGDILLPTIYFDSLIVSNEVLLKLVCNKSNESEFENQMLNVIKRYDIKYGLIFNISKSPVVFKHVINSDL